MSLLFFFFFWFKVKMETTFLSETFYLEITIFGSFWKIWMIRVYPTSLNLYENLMDYLNGLKIILLGTSPFHINILWKKILNRSNVFVMFLWRVGNVE